MKDNREYKILLETVAYNGCVSQIWACNISHAKFIDGIQNGGLHYFGGKRQRILNFQATPVVTEDAITCGGRFGCE